MKCAAGGGTCSEEAIPGGMTWKGRTSLAPPISLCFLTSRTGVALSLPALLLCFSLLQNQTSKTIGHNPSPLLQVWGVRYCVSLRKRVTGSDKNMRMLILPEHFFHCGAS